MTSRSPLRQLLQDQQEPFELEGYLCERDYSRKSLSQGSGFACSGGKLGSIMKFGKGFAEINKMLRHSSKKLVSFNRKQQTEDLGKNGWIFSVGCKRVAESENFSSPCSPRKTFGSFSGKNNEETSSSTRRNHVNSSTSDIFEAPEPCNLQELKAAAGKRVVSRSMEPSKQLSLGLDNDFKSSMSMKLPPYTERKQSKTQARPNENRLHKDISLQKKVPDDSILSATLWELLLYSATTEKTSGIETAELQELVASNPAPQLLISKRVIHQTKQLLFDCVREVVESHSKQGSHMGSEAGRLSYEKEATAEEAKLTNLLNSDYLLSVAEWKDLKPQKQLIEKEIGEVILQEIISEAVTELTDNQ